MVTGCCNTTIQKVYFNILLAKGDTRKPEHGMKHHWKRQRKNSTKSCEEVLHSSSKGLAKKMKISRINKDKQQSVTFALTESTHLKPDVTLTESTHLKPVNVTLTEPPQSVAFVETKQAVMSTVNNVQLPIEAMPTAAAPVCGQIAAISSEGSPGNQNSKSVFPKPCSEESFVSIPGLQNSKSVFPKPCSEESFVSIPGLQNSKSVFPKPCSEESFVSIPGLQNSKSVFPKLCSEESFVSIPGLQKSKSVFPKLCSEEPFVSIPGLQNSKSVFPKLCSEEPWCFARHD
uniref:Uncharacterized protein n=1 Tax=Biomphalaria glabrata TaxID=6526 RepID=A0A2C9KBT8_BIOGL